MGEKEMNIHPEADKLRNDIETVISLFNESKSWSVIGNFEEFLKEHGVEIAHITLYKYLTETTPPGWIMPFLCEFLTEEPYIRYQHVWSFIREWSDPIKKARDRISQRAFKTKADTLAQAEKLSKYI